jgi:hypothetical protein
MTFVIANGGTESAGKQLLSQHLIGLDMPAAFTGTSVTFEVSQDNVTYKPVTKDDGNAYTVTVAANKVVAINAAYTALMSRYTYLRIKSNAAEGAERTIEAITR